MLLKDATFGWRLLWLVAFIIRPFFLRLRVEGAHYLPKTGGCVLASNHTTGPDFVILGYAAPRQVYFMAKAEIFYYQPWITRLVATAGAFPVHRGMGDTGAMEQSIQLINAGKVLGMFPEGTRSRNGQLQSGKTGVARIALAAGVPIVPAVVINSEPVLRNWRMFQRRPVVTVRFGPAFVPGGSSSDPVQIQQVTDDNNEPHSRSAPTRAARRLCRLLTVFKIHQLAQGCRSKSALPSYWGAPTWRW